MAMTLPPYYPSTFVSNSAWTFNETTNPTDTANIAAVPSSYFIVNGNGDHVYFHSSNTAVAENLDPITGFTPDVGRNYLLRTTIRKTTAATNGVTSWLRPGFIVFPTVDPLLYNSANNVIITPTNGQGFFQPAGLQPVIDTSSWIVGQWYESYCTWVPQTTYDYARPRIRINRNELDVAPYSNAEYELKLFEVLPQIKMSDIHTEFGGSLPASLSHYYRGGANVTDSPTNSRIPTSGTISFSDFLGASAVPVNPPPVWNTAAGSLGSVEGGNAFPFTFSVTDANAVTFALANSTVLPPGLTLNSNGVITGNALIVGTPTTTNFTVGANDGTYTVNRNFSISVTVNALASADTVVLLHMDGTNGSPTFTDAKGHTVTRYGTATISTAQSKFGGASGFFTNKSGIFMADDPIWNFGTGDFTIEAWVYATSVSAGAVVLGKSDVPGGGGNGTFALKTYDPGGGYQFYPQIYDSSGHFWSIPLGLVVLNQWAHIALTRFSGVYYGFLDGVQGGSSIGSALTTGVILSSNQPCNIGVHWQGPAQGQDWPGYIDELRVIKGYAAYRPVVSSGGSGDGLQQYVPATAPFS